MSAGISLSLPMIDISTRVQAMGRGEEKGILVN